MKQFMKRIVLAAVFLTASLMSVVSVEAKTIRKNVVLLEGTTRKVSMDSSDVENLKISGKKYASVKAKDFYVTIAGKKAGKTEISFDIPALKYKYKIKATVLSLKKTKKTAHTQLKQYLKKQKSGTKYMYTDLNRDGINELCLKNKFVYYDYQKKKLSNVKHNFSEIYTSEKSKNIYCILRNPRTTEEFVYFSAIYTPKATTVFGLKDTGKGFRQYTKQGQETYGTEKPFAFYDTYFDQDDYDYQGLTQEEADKRLKKYVPAAVKLEWKKKK